mgnify:CR=1 FL=1
MSTPYFALYPTDFLADVGHLGNTELGIYWRLLLVYYRDERPLPFDTDRLRRIAMVFSPEEFRCLDQVVSEFFVLSTDGDGRRVWRHRRADEEIQKASSRIDAKRSGAEKARAKLAEKRRNSLISELMSDQTSGVSSELITGGDKEPEPEKKYTPAEAGGPGGCASVGPAQVAPVVAPPGVPAGDSSELVPRVRAKKPPKKAGDSLDADALARSIGAARPIVEAWLTIRIQKKVGPVTAGALEMLRTEAGKAGIPVSEAVSECVSRGWAGFKASWLANEVRGVSVAQAQPVNKFAGVI